MQSEVLDSFLGPARKERKEMWVEIKGPKGQVCNFKACKEIDPEDPGLALSTVFMLAFLLNAGVRGLLRMHGYDYRFLEPKPKSPIVTL